jgi:hypothetical protein
MKEKGYPPPGCRRRPPQADSSAWMVGTCLRSCSIRPILLKRMSLIRRICGSARHQSNNHIEETLRRSGDVDIWGGAPSHHNKCVDFIYRREGVRPPDAYVAPIRCRSCVAPQHGWWDMPSILYVPAHTSNTHVLSTKIRIYSRLRYYIIVQYFNLRFIYLLAFYRHIRLFNRSAVYNSMLKVY